MSMLPQELITEILYWLPVKSLVRFQVVSKFWHALINDLDFIMMHLQSSVETQREYFILPLRPSYIAHPQEYMFIEFPNDNWLSKPSKVCPRLCLPEGFFRSRNSFNGLFCYYNYSGEIVLWNPSIRKHKKLPPVQIDAPYLHRTISNIAIGYDAVNNDYKVLSIWEVYKSIELIRVFDIQVYSLKENAMRRVEDKWPLEKSPYFWDETTYSNGNLHWLISNISGEDVIVAFDLTTEKFRVHALPPLKSLLLLCLKSLRGLLCATTYDEDWIMKEYGVVSSWTPLNTSSLIHESLMISVFGQKIMLQKEIKEHFWYDEEKKTQITMEVQSIDYSFLLIPCQGSLVLLDGDNDN